VLGGFLNALGVPAEDVPADEDARGALFRSMLAGKRALVVLDNARDAGQVRPLLPGPSRCLVLVTSREDLRGLTATHGAHLVHLPVLEPAAAVALLGRAGEDVEELATLCGRLPLALHIAAGKLAAATPVSDLVSALRGGDLTELAHRRTAVRAAFDVSYAALPEAARFAFRLLGLVPGTDFTAAAVAALAGLPTQAAAAVLDRLAAAHMVEPSGPGRFACHDLLRRYARELAPADSTSARHALANHYLATALAAADHVSPNMARVPGPPVTATPAPLPDLATALTWLDAERANLVAAVGLVPGGWRLVDALRGYLSMRVPRAGWAAAAKVGLAAAVAEDSQVGQAAMHISLGLLAWCEGRYADSATHYRTASALANDAHWPEGESTALNGCGRAEIGVGRLTEAVTTLTDALAIDRAAGFRAGEARELYNIGLALQGLGRLADAVEHQHRALTLYEEIGDRKGSCVVADNLAWVRKLAGGPDSLADHASALAMGTDVGWQHAQAGVLRTIAALHRDAAQFSAARRYADRAVALARVGGEHQVQVDALTVLGDALVGLGHYGAAERCYTEARTAAESSGFAAGRVDALLGLADLHLRLPAPATARALADDALSVARAHHLLVQEGKALTLLAAATTALGRRDEATRHAELAVATHRRTGHRAGAAAALTLLTGLRDDDG
jgi:tetratricopeptide (TPR) repeat protein